MHTRIVVGIMLSVALIGCAPKKQSVVPQVLSSKTFPSMTKNYRLKPDQSMDAWWHQFHDPELNRLIRSGIACNPDVHIAIANLQKAKAVLQQVKLSWVPLLQIFGGYSTNPMLGIPGGFYGVWPYYAVNVMKLISQQKEQQFEVAYHRAVINSVRLVLIGQIASAYFTVQAQKEQLNLMTQFLEDSERLIKLSQKDIDIGLSNDVDLDELIVAVNLIKAQQQEIKHNITVGENALRFLTNQNPGSVTISKRYQQTDFSRFKPGALPARVLQNRPDLRMAELAVEKDYAGIAVAWSDFFPTLQLDDFIGEAHLPSSQFEQATDAYLKGTIAAATFAKAKAQKGVYKASVAKYIKTVRQILQEVDNDYSANKTAAVAYQASVKALRTYQHKYQLQQGLYKTGLISYKDLLNSKLALDELALSNNQAKLKLAMTLVLLYQDLGGGYTAKSLAKGNYSASFTEKPYLAHLERKFE